MLKLSQYGLGGMVSNCIKSCLSNRRQQIVPNGYNSPWKMIKSGISNSNEDKSVGEQKSDTTDNLTKEEKKAKKKADKKAAKKANSDTTNEVVDVGRLDFRIGRIISVKRHVNADSLYVEKVDIGEPKPREVVSGLVKYMPASDLKDRIVVLLCNPRPAKMRGVLSEAMVMVASTPEKVEVLTPPEGSLPGDLIEFEGYERKPDAVLKKNVYETCSPDLKTDENCVAKYKDAPFVVPGKGNVTSQTLANAPIK